MNERLGTIRELMRAGDLEAAERLAVRHLPSLPEDADLAVVYARIPEQAGRFAEAVARWRNVLKHFPGHRAALVGLNYCLIADGRYAEARTQIEAALREHPGDESLLRQSADLAGRQGDWPRAIELYRQVLRQYPQNPSVRLELRHAEAQRQLTALAAADAPDAWPADCHPPRPARLRADVRDIIVDFESLGDNCEFGFLQRHFGHEPLGLLRWAGTEPAPIIAAVRSQFAGVGEREHVTIELWPDGEYKISDDRYGMVSHTFIYEAAFPRETFLDHQMRRMRILKKKLLQEMTRGERLFVYKSPTMTLEQAQALCVACRQVGPLTLLVVRLCDQSHPAGTVERAAPDLLFGYLDHIPPVDDITGSLLIACWETLCIRAWALWKGDRSGRHGAASKNRNMR